jgi:hypothetical protein
MEQSKRSIRRRVEQILRRKVFKGDLIRPDICELCGTSLDRIVGHHWRGYDYPFDVWWVCDSCNRLLKDHHDSSMTKEQARNFVLDHRVYLIENPSGKGSWVWGRCGSKTSWTVWRTWWDRKTKTARWKYIARVNNKGDFPNAIDAEAGCE